MIESFKKMFRVSMFTSIFFIIVGLFLFLKPATTITTISYVIGGIFLVIGISYLIKYFSYPNVPVSLNLILGVVSSIIGLFLILKPTLITVAILNAMWIWNDYLLPYLVIGVSTPYKTIPVAVQYLMGSYGAKDYGSLMALLVLSIIPIIVFYLSCQKHIIEGVVAGAVKG